MLEANARTCLIFEDDVEFLPHFTPHAAGRAAAFLHDSSDVAGDGWSIFFLGHFPKKIELTSRPEIVRVRSMDGHAYVLSRAGARGLCALSYAGEQVDVHFHYRCDAAYALYPMVAVQTPGASDTEGLQRAEDWNQDKLDRERDLYQGCVSRKALAAAVGSSTEALAMMGLLSGPTWEVRPEAAYTPAAAEPKDVSDTDTAPTRLLASLSPASALAQDVCSKDEIGQDKMVENTFEWVAGWNVLESLLRPSALGLRPTARAVDLGCGFSTLPLHLASLYAEVLALDREEHCVETMTARYERCGCNGKGARADGNAGSRLRWAVCDVCSADGLAQSCGPGSADLVVDKGTLDCAIVEQDAARLLCNVAWLLAPGGVYVVISFRKPALLLAVLSCAELAWTVKHQLLELPGSEPASFCVLRRKNTSAGASTPPDVEAVARHVQLVADDWYTRVDPLLTREREERTRVAWAAVLAKTGHASGELLPLRTAFEVLLTAEERGEIEFGDFMSDIAPFVERSSGSSAENNGGERMSSDGESLIGLTAGLAYLQEQQ